MPNYGVITPGDNKLLAVLGKALFAIQDQIHESAEQKVQQEQEFKNSAETKTTIPAMWRPIA